MNYGRRVTIAPKSALLIVGPTQAGKTSSIVVPALLRWTDALVVTSVKNDVIAATSRWRCTLGETQILEPGLDGGLTWNPLEGVTTLRHALRVARDLTIGSSGHGDTEFWNSLATKLVAGLMRSPSSAATRFLRWRGSSRAATCRDGSVSESHRLPGSSCGTSSNTTRGPSTAC